MNDTIRNGIIAGLLGSIGDAVVHWGCYFTLGTSTTSHYIAQLIFPFKEGTLIRLMFGFITHLSAGALVGVALALIFKYFGSDYPYYKGLGVAITLWIVHVAVIPNIVAPRPYLHRTELEALVDFVAHISYGIFSTFYLVRSYRNESLLK